MYLTVHCYTCVLWLVFERAFVGISDFRIVRRKVNGIALHLRFTVLIAHATTRIDF